MYKLFIGCRLFLMFNCLLPVSRPISLTRGRRNTLRENTHSCHRQLCFIHISNHASDSTFSSVGPHSFLLKNETLPSAVNSVRVPSVFSFLPPLFLAAARVLLLPKLAACLVDHVMLPSCCMRIALTPPNSAAALTTPHTRSSIHSAALIQQLYVLKKRYGGKSSNAGGRPGWAGASLARGGVGGWGGRGGPPGGVGRAGGPGGPGRLGGTCVNLDKNVCRNRVECRFEGCY